MGPGRSGCLLGLQDLPLDTAEEEEEEEEEEECLHVHLTVSQHVRTFLLKDL